MRWYFCRFSDICAAKSARYIFKDIAFAAFIIYYDKDMRWAGCALRFLHAAFLRWWGDIFLFFYRRRPPYHAKSRSVFMPYMMLRDSGARAYKIRCFLMIYCDTYAFRYEDIHYAARAKRKMLMVYAAFMMMMMPPFLFCAIWYFSLRRHEDDIFVFRYLLRGALILWCRDAAFSFYAMRCRRYLFLFSSFFNQREEEARDTAKSTIKEMPRYDAATPLLFAHYDIITILLLFIMPLILFSYEVARGAFHYYDTLLFLFVIYILFSRFSFSFFVLLILLLLL